MMPEELAAAFTEQYGGAPAGVWAAPGRLNLIGEHTDYNDGLVLPIALPMRTLAAVGRRRDGRLAVASAQHPRDVVELPLTDLRPGNPGGWAGYPAGVVHALLDVVTAAGGVSVLVDGDVPAGAGLSSSAALTCAVALAVRDALGLELTSSDLVEVARTAENDFVGAPTGVLDQSASLLCEAGSALFLDVRTRSAEQVPLDLVGAGLQLLVVDTGVTHRHADGGYGRRRRECEAAAAVLGVPALRDAELPAVEALTDQLLRRRARHVVTENARVQEVVDLLRGGDDPRPIGPVLTAGHLSLRNDFAVSTVELDAVVDTALAAGAHGARMVGGGFGGSALVLVDTGEGAMIAAATETRLRELGVRPRTFVVVPAGGARRLS